MGTAWEETGAVRGDRGRFQNTASQWSSVMMYEGEREKEKLDSLICSNKADPERRAAELLWLSKHDTTSYNTGALNLQGAAAWRYALSVSKRCLNASDKKVSAYSVFQWALFLLLNGSKSFFETPATDLGWEVYAVVDSGLDLKFRGTSEVGAKTSTGLDRAAGARHTLFNFLRTGDRTHDFVPAGTGKLSTTQLHLWLPSFVFFFFKSP